ncbi:hypothetical protein AWC38_SpisGene10775 [Stylophora pistillata]|uniref:Endonuclease/exonuclease/phosphatase domain-containing protein n=1 Tax=Stylophora pistillata TaxID=50429 RepID=A0A2B4S732_STYPI|nr:hypothetical protein AWC38_SpisGene10775 [Stylophora pistillata]
MADSRVFPASMPVSWTFNRCAVASLPFFKESLSDDSNTLTFPSDKSSKAAEDEELTTTLLKFSIKNLKIGHVNINSVDGFKFYELKSLILKSLFDIMESHEVESISLCVQTSSRTKKVLVIGMYRPPGLLKTTWEHEINNILLRATQRYESIMLIGDLNCDLSRPNKGAKEGKPLIDLMDVYGLTNLIKAPTGVVVESSSLIDVILKNKPRSVLTSGVFGVSPSDMTGRKMRALVHPSIVATRKECVAAQFEFDHVSVAETELILKSLDPNKATDHDQIPARVLRDGVSVLAVPVAHLVNAGIDYACVPTDWKLAEICSIFKRDDEFDKSKYRLVSILVLLDKGFERCVQKQLVHYFDLHLSKFLSAYRKGYSCESVLLNLIEDWKGAVENNFVAGSVLVDLSKVKVKVIFI